MKKIAVLLAVLAASFAGCQKPVLEEPVEVNDTFTASVEEFASQTKTSMNSDKQTLWSAGDRLVIFRGKFEACEYQLADESAGSQSGTFKYVSGDKVTGNEVPCNVAYYPYAEGLALSAELEISNVVLPEVQVYAENSFANGAFPMVAVTESVNNRALKFKNVAGAMNLQFKGTQKVLSVKVEGNAGEALSGAAVVTADDTPSVKMQSAEAAAVVLDCGEGVQLSETEATSFILALPPVQFTEGFTVTILDADNLVYTVVNEVENEVLRSGILVMPELTLDVKDGVPVPEPEPVISEWGLVGSFQGWDVANSMDMFCIADDWSVIKNVELYKDDEFKFAKNKSWDLSFGTSSVVVLEENKEITAVTANSQNMKVGKNGKYNLYLNPTTKKVKVECVEEYTDLKVKLTINNKANWSPLYINLKDGDNTIADAVLVTDNVYEVSGEYIGKSLTYYFTSGDKSSDPANVTITKNGASVTIEENVVKLYFELNTANEQTYWGTTTKIHVWNTGTSFDTSWPGTEMTKEGTYKWSIIVPSELVGKTINFLVHNGNGWQSPDSKVTIKAEGVTVTSKGLGIK